MSSKYLKCSDPYADELTKSKIETDVSSAKSATAALDAKWATDFVATADYNTYNTDTVDASTTATKDLLDAVYDKTYVDNKFNTELPGLRDTVTTAAKAGRKAI